MRRADIEADVAGDTQGMHRRRRTQVEWYGLVLGRQQSSKVLHNGDEEGQVIRRIEHQPSPVRVHDVANRT